MFKPQRLYSRPRLFKLGKQRRPVPANWFWLRGGPGGKLAQPEQLVLSGKFVLSGKLILSGKFRSGLDTLDVHAQIVLAMPLLAAIVFAPAKLDHGDLVALEF